MTDESRSRRGFLGAVTATVATTVLAGCLDSIPFIGDAPITFAADPVSVPGSTLDETGYEHQGTDDFVVTETFEAAGQQQEVEVTNWMAEYDRSMDLGALDAFTGRVRAGLFVALSTPRVRVLGRTFNPVGDMSAAELATMVQDHYEGIGDLEQVDSVEATVAGQSTTVVEFETTAELAEVNTTVDLTLHVAEAVAVGDDFVVVIGGYPTGFSQSERMRIFDLAAAVEHS